MDTLAMEQRTLFYSSSINDLKVTRGGDLIVERASLLKYQGHHRAAKEVNQGGYNNSIFPQKPPKLVQKIVHVV